jgi:peptidoglycan-associated lipoprotein
MNKRVWLAIAAAALLAGCSSVPLDEAPVEDRRGAAVTPPTGDTGARSGVAPVTVDPTVGNTIGPAGVARIVYFDYDSYVIKPQFQGVIESHARFLKSNGGRKIMIEGHTDERGGREYNLALGQRRAEAVRRALGLLGVTDAQVEAVSFGKEKPAATGSDESAWSQNRRAEIAYR